VKSFVEIVEYLFSVSGVTIFLSGWLSQDSLEKLFGCQRHWGKSNENPNVHDFGKNTQVLRVINTVCKKCHRGNCRGSKHSIDWEAESKPLPKRRFRSANKEMQVMLSPRMNILLMEYILQRVKTLTRIGIRVTAVP